MQEESFRLWLSNNRFSGDSTTLDIRTISSRISNCRTVERYEGDLDLQFDQDRLNGLIQRLKYSTEDERASQPPRHKVPINGNIRNGTATLRSAVSLYKQFRENWVEGTPLPSSTVKGSSIRTSCRASRSQELRAWPTWEQPGPEEILAMAHLAVPFVRFLSPDIVRAVVEDNEQHRESWREALQTRDVNPDAYLWPRSPCAFPGIRRYAGSREVAAHRGHTSLDDNRPLNAALDDNDYPKQLWSFVFRGVQFSKFGPEGYALAHLADHKDHGNRFEKDFQITDTADSPRPLFGLYTCPSNTVYIPLNLIKPTDFVGTVRALLVRRAQQLYGSFCKILPPFLGIPEPHSAEWNVTEFKWSEPVGTMTYVQSFLEFRHGRLAKLIEASREISRGSS